MLPDADQANVKDSFELHRGKVHTIILAHFLTEDTACLQIKCLALQCVH